MTAFNHFDEKGRVRMVDVTEKSASSRLARAQAVISMSPETFRALLSGDGPKGNALETARIAGIMAAKRTADLIPMCHPLNLSHAAVDFYPDETAPSIRIETSARVRDATGVEMEALTAAAVAALTLYDMCKAADRFMVISDVQLLEKTGGKSGRHVRDKNDAHMRVD
ncbi:MAG: cyclic pyranopterin monophosphate synthase MoaC [Desulfobacterales bacterium]|nr:MAG: cyclic pyranopterin monophosphate synthase MoaC [Desulfobacterales bacterium]